MSEMLTAKEMQDLLQVDRSTIYRMAESGKLPAIKVGKQWRFPSEQVDSWFHGQVAKQATPRPASVDNRTNGSS
jgi:excisionase family DNA binding protein